MVAQGAFAGVNFFDDARLEPPEAFKILVSHDEDEVKVGALGVEVGGVGHADGAGWPIRRNLYSGMNPLPFMISFTLGPVAVIGLKIVG